MVLIFELDVWLYGEKISVFIGLYRDVPVSPKRRIHWWGGDSRVAVIKEGWSEATGRFRGRMLRKLERRVCPNRAVSQRAT
jgi:hypothetical protein